MTVPTEVNKSGPYNGNGSARTFAYRFYTTDERHLDVFQYGPTGAQTKLVLTNQYTVTGVGNQDGGTVRLVAPLPVGQKLLIVLNVPYTQEIDLQNQGAYYAETVEKGFDLAVQRDQQLRDGLSRSLKTNDAGTAIDATGLPIINLGTGTGNSNAATVGQLNDLRGEFGAGGMTIRSMKKAADLGILSSLTVEDGDAIYVSGYASRGDGGGGILEYNAGSVKADNGGTCFAAPPLVGRFMRPEDGRLRTKWFGIRHDGSDPGGLNCAKLQSAINEAWSTRQHLLISANNDGNNGGISLSGGEVYVNGSGNAGGALLAHGFGMEGEQQRYSIIRDGVVHLGRVGGFGVDGAASGGLRIRDFCLRNAGIIAWTLETSSLIEGLRIWPGQANIDNDYLQGLGLLAYGCNHLMLYHNRIEPQLVYDCYGMRIDGCVNTQIIGGGGSSVRKAIVQGPLYLYRGVTLPNGTEIMPGDTLPNSTASQGTKIFFTHFESVIEESILIEDASHVSIRFNHERGSSTAAPWNAPHKTRWDTDYPVMRVGRAVAAWNVDSGPQTWTLADGSVLTEYSVPRTWKCYTGHTSGGAFARGQFVMVPYDAGKPAWSSGTVYAPGDIVNASILEGFELLQDHTVPQGASFSSYDPYFVGMTYWRPARTATPRGVSEGDNFFVGSPAPAGSTAIRFDRADGVTRDPSYFSSFEKGVIIGPAVTNIDQRGLTTVGVVTDLEIGQTLTGPGVAALPAAARRTVKISPGSNMIIRGNMGRRYSIALNAAGRTFGNPVGLVAGERYEIEFTKTAPSGAVDWSASLSRIKPAGGAGPDLGAMATDGVCIMTFRCRDESGTLVLREVSRSIT